MILIDSCQSQVELRAWNWQHSIGSCGLNCPYSKVSAVPLVVEGIGVWQRVA
jgi:hypothetical protein